MYAVRSRTPLSVHSILSTYSLSRNRRPWACMFTPEITYLVGSLSEMLLFPVYGIFFLHCASCILCSGSRLQPLPYWFPSQLYKYQTVTQPTAPRNCQTRSSSSLYGIKMPTFFHWWSRSMLIQYCKEGTGRLSPASYQHHSVSDRY